MAPNPLMLAGIARVILAKGSGMGYPMFFGL
jgi:hypothetical protein